MDVTQALWLRKLEGLEVGGLEYGREEERKQECAQRKLSGLASLGVEME